MGSKNRRLRFQYLFRFVLNLQSVAVSRFHSSISWKYPSINTSYALSSKQRPIRDQLNETASNIPPCFNLYRDTKWCFRPRTVLINHTSINFRCLSLRNYNDIFFFLIYLRILPVKHFARYCFFQFFV